MPIDFLLGLDYQFTKLYFVQNNTNHDLMTEKDNQIRLNIPFFANVIINIQPKLHL
jgi:hypothetical protein